MSKNDVTTIKTEYIDKIRSLEAGGVFYQLNYFCQHEHFTGNRQEAVKKLMNRFSGMSENEVNKAIDYLYTIDVGMEDMIKE